MKNLIFFIMLFTFYFNCYAQDINDLNFQTMRYLANSIIIDDDYNMPHHNQSFSQSKKLMKKVYYDNQYSFYCGCKYDYKQISGREKTVVDMASCGYVSRKHVERGKFIE